MKIDLMTDDNIETIIDIDYVAFQKEHPRITKNMKALRMSDPEGCFVVREGASIVGYVFSKVLGDEGYMGPVGVHPDFQNKGYGQALILKSLDYLKKQCRTIGLEVHPAKGNNIEIYHKLGFISCFPSLILELPKGLTLHPNFVQLIYLDRESTDRKHLIEGLKGMIELSGQGQDYTNDLNLTLDMDGNIIIALDGDKLLGFMAYSKSFLPFVWGVIIGECNEIEVSIALISAMSGIYKDENLLIEVNSRYVNAIKVLIECKCKVVRSINRMLLTGYEGNYLNQSSHVCMRQWLG